MYNSELHHIRIDYFGGVDYNILVYKSIFIHITWVSLKIIVEIHIGTHRVKIILFNHIGKSDSPRKLETFHSIERLTHLVNFMTFFCDVYHYLMDRLFKVLYCFIYRIFTISN